MTPSEYLRAPDVFISYRRSDAATYVNHLAARLSAGSIYCIIDQWHSDPDRRLPRSLLKLVKQARVLVVVGSREAKESNAMRQEICAFLPSKRTIIPVDADGSIRTADWWPLLEGLHPIADHSALPDVPKAASADVVEQILSAVDFTTRDQRLKAAARRSLRALAAALLLSIMAGGGSYWWVSNAEAKAETADTKRINAERASREATKARDGAYRERNAAVEASGKARNRAALAEKDRQSAASAEAKALERANANEQTASEAENRARDAKLREDRSLLITRARYSLAARDTEQALDLARLALKKQDGDDARLILAEAWNSGVAASQIQVGRRMFTFEANPVKPDQIAAITTVTGTETGTQLEIHERGRTAPIVAAEYRYLNLRFDPSGDSIYAIGQDQPRRPQTRYIVAEQITWRTWVIHYDLNLKLLSKVELGPFSLPETPRKIPLESAESMRIIGSRLLFAGSAREGPFSVHPVIGWVDLTTMRPEFNVETRPWETYSAQLALVDSNNLVVDSREGLLLLKLPSGQKEKVKATNASNLLLAGDAESGQFVAARNDTNRVSTFRRDASGKWQEKVYELDEPGACVFVSFLDETHVALARYDGSVWLLNVDPYFDGFGNQNSGWREPVARKLGTHDSTITSLVVSPDKRWIATSGADNTIQIWSVFGGATRQFQLGSSAVEHLRWSKDSNYLYAADVTGIVRVFRPESAGRFTLRANPVSKLPEFQVPPVLASGNRDDFLKHFGFIQTFNVTASGSLNTSTFDNVYTEWDLDYRVRSSTFVGGPAKPGGPTPPPYEPHWRVEQNAAERSLDIYDAQTGAPQLRVAFPNAKRLTSKYHKESPLGKALAIELDMGGDAICVVDMVHYRVRVHRFESTGNRSFKYLLSDDATLFAVNEKGRIFASFANTGALTQLGAHGNVLPGLVLSPDGHWLATTGPDNSIRLWNRSGDYSEYRLPNRILSVHFSQRGTELLAASGSSLHSWAVPGDELVTSILGQLPPQPAAVDDTTGSPLSVDGLDVFQYNQAAGAWEQTTPKPPQPPTVADNASALAGTLASGTATPDERLAAAHDLARLHATESQAVQTALGALPTALFYPAIADATIDYLKSAGPGVEPILFDRIESERDAEVEASLLWAAEQLYPRSPRLAVAVGNGLTSSNAELQLVSAAIASEGQKNRQILRVLLSWRESKLIPRKDVSRMVLQYDSESVAAVLPELQEADQGESIKLIAEGGAVALPLLKRLAKIPADMTVRRDLRSALASIAPETIADPALGLNDLEPQSSPSDKEWWQRGIAALRQDTGTKACEHLYLPKVWQDTPEAKQMRPLMREAATLLFEKARAIGADPGGVSCLKELGEMGPDSGIEISQLLSLLEPASRLLVPLSYALTDAVVDNLEDMGVPAAATKALRAAVPVNWVEGQKFEEQLKKLLGDEQWNDSRKQILRASGKPVARRCDPSGAMAALIRAIEVHGTEAAEAEQPLRNIAARFDNCTDLIPAVAGGLNRIKGWW